MTKICYIAPYRDGTGYAHSAIDHILALDSVGITVAPRPVKMTPTKGEVPDRIKELEDNDLNNVDVVIQHNLPSEFVYKGGVQNVGIFAYETNSFPNCLWKDHLQMMDKIVVSCSFQKAAVYNTGGDEMGDKTYVVHHPVDTSKFDQKYETMHFDMPDNAIKFYTIAEFGRRKNLVALITGYYSAFSCFDNVILIIKTHMPGRNSEEAAQSVSELCQQIKKDLGRFQDEEYYPRIALLTDYLPNKHINSLHVTGNVFVTASHGEAICLPYLDALGFGNPCIVPFHTAFQDYFVDEHLLIESGESIAFGVKDAPPGLYTADEKWGNVFLPSLVEQMRFAYSSFGYHMNDGMINKRKQMVEHLSYKNTGNRLKEILDAK